jgi:predicted MFS family arabinose efflux permease
MHSAQSSTTDTARAALVAAVVLSLGGAVGLGFGRFAYALLLEPMRADLGWSYAQAGAINSANAIGYLIGSLVVGPAVARFGPTRTLRIGTWAASLSLIALGLTGSFSLLFLLRLINGFAGGLIFVGGASVLLLRGGAAAGSMPLSVYYSGPGIGITLSGLAVPLMLSAPLNLNWPIVWIGLGVCGLAALALMEPFLRRSAPAQRPRAERAKTAATWADYRRIWPALAAFGIYGIGYIGYMTFVVAFLQSLGADAAAVQIFWVILGISAALSGFTWGPLIAWLPPACSLPLPSPRSCPLLRRMPGASRSRRSSSAAPFSPPSPP